jgi:aspartate carbamoyltransferase regulatory subunit
MEERLLVRKIENGTVIDHIPAGRGLEVIDLLNIDLAHDETAVILVNVKSGKMGNKDVIKVENRQLSESEVNKIALIAPDATLNIIKNWDVVDKQTVEIPRHLIDVLECPNTSCITRDVKTVKSRFTVENKDPLKVRCHYCERAFHEEDIL